MAQGPRPVGSGNRVCLALLTSRALLVNSICLLTAGLNRIGEITCGKFMRLLRCRSIVISAGVEGVFDDAGEGVPVSRLRLLVFGLTVAVGLLLLGVDSRFTRLSVGSSFLSY